MTDLGKPKKKGSGSLLGNLAHETYSAITGLPEVPIVVGSALGHDIHDAFEHPLRNSSIWAYATGGKQPAPAEAWAKLLHPTISNAWWHVDPLLHGDVGETYGRFKKDPLNPILDVAALFTAGAARGLAVADTRALNVALKATDETAAAAHARIAKAVVTGRYQRDPGAIKLNLRGGKEITARELPRNAYRATRMQVTDRMLKKLPPELAVLGEYARAARRVKTNSVRRQLAKLADTRYEAYGKAWSKLDRYQRVAVALLARVPLREDLEAWAAKLPDNEIGNETRALVTHPDVLAHYDAAYGPDGLPATDVAAANEAGRTLSQAREDILRQTTPIDEATLEAAKYRHTRAARGAEYVEPTPGRIGRPSPALLSARGRVAGLQRQVDLLTARTAGTGKWKAKFLPDRPRTFEEAQAELERLQTAHNKGLEKIRQAWFGKADKGDVAFRRRESEKARRQRAGVTRAGKRSGAAGFKATDRKTFVQETRDLTLQRLEEMQRQHPDHPVVKAWFERADEIQSLQDAINMHKLGGGETYAERQAAREAEAQQTISAVQGGPLTESTFEERQAQRAADREQAAKGPVVRLADNQSLHGGYIQKPATYLRFGDLPKKGEASWNHLADQPEPGVSVYAAWKDPATGKYVLPSGSEQYVATMQEFGDRPIYEVKGKEHPTEVGDDGEPLLQTGSAEVVRPVKRDEVVAESDPNLTLDGTELPPEQTPDWHKQEPAPKAGLKKPAEAPFGMMTEKPPPGAVPLRGEWTMAERRRIGHIFEPSNREFDVEGEIKSLNKQIRDLEKTLPEDAPEVLDWVKQQMAWQKINLLARNMGNVAQVMAEHGGTLTHATKIPSREEMAAIIADLKQKIYDSRASSRDVRNVINKLSRVLEELRKERKRLNTGSRQLPSGQVITAEGAILHPRGYHKLQRLSAALSVAKEQLDQAERRAVNRLEETGLVGGGTPEEIRAEIEAANRPQPYYVPDKPLEAKRVTGPPMGATGLTPRRALADIHQSKLTRFNMGMLALHPDLIGPSYLSAVAHDYYLDLHANAVRLARPFGENEVLPKGWSYVREERGQRVPPTVAGAGEHRGELAQAFPDISDYPGLTLTGKEAEDAAMIARDAEGRRLAVPDSFAKTLHAEQRKAATGLRLFFDRLFSVWRSLVLHLRIPWLENNVLGNGLLWTIRFAGIDGLKAMLGLISTTKGGAKARQMLGFAEQHGHLTDADMRELAAEQYRGTFIHTQLPTTPLGRRLDEHGGLLRKIHQFGPQTWLPAVDRITEQWYRRTALEKVLRGTPEVQAFYHSLEPGTRTMREALRRGLQDPRVRELATREVNDGLGDYLSLSPMERHGVRGLFPFYAWYREITRIALKLPIDAPGRTAIIMQLGEIAQQQLDDRSGPLPTYLRGVIPLGAPRGDRQKILNLNAANPFTTNTQLGLGAAAMLGIGPHQRAGAQNLLSTINPFYMTTADYLMKLKAGTAPTGPGGLGRYFWTDFLKQLPEARPITARPSPLYPGRTQADLWRQFLGLPVATYSRGQARKYAGEGR